MTKLAFVFPGQGSQGPGMCTDLARNHQRVGETFARAGKLLQYDLWDLVLNGPADKLDSTEVTQPALLVAGYATWQVWTDSGGPAPVFMAGHSLGEYTALVCAGVLDFDDAVTLVRERGRLMQGAVPAGTGSMAAIIGLDDATVDTICSEASRGDILSPANFNSPGQIVIAGSSEAVQRACELARTRGAKMAKPLAVSVPSHCELMKPAAEHFATLLEQTHFSPAQIPVIQNTDARVHDNPDEIKELLLQQLFRPVLWQDCINTMVAAGVTTVVECGPGKVLSGLVRRINREVNCYNLMDSAGLEKTLEGTGT